MRIIRQCPLLTVIIGGLPFAFAVGTTRIIPPDFRYTVMMTTTSDKFKALPVFRSVMVEGRPVGSFSIFTTVVSSYDAADTVAEAKHRL